jgi:hypothetical protein
MREREEERKNKNRHTKRQRNGDRVKPEDAMKDKAKNSLNAHITSDLFC